MTWSDRLEEMGAHRASELAWSDLWPFVARAGHDKGLPWLDEILWKLQQGSWLISLDPDPLTCRACGGLIENGHVNRRHCSSACRKIAYRRREAGQSTDLDLAVQRGHELMAQVQSELKRTTRWYHNIKRAYPKVVFVAPDLSRVRHLPFVPARCGNCSLGGPCQHTGGGPCLFALTTPYRSKP